MGITLRALERDDLRFIHNINNNRRVMTYWFEEPYESFVELEELYLKNIHNQTERRFIIQDEDETPVGLVEIVEITYIHRRAEFQIIIAPSHQGKGFGRMATLRALDYGFTVLNLRKIYLIVDSDNDKAMNLYSSCGFIKEGHLVEEFFSDGAYRDAIRMYQLQDQFLERRKKS